MPFALQKTTGLWPGWILKFEAPSNLTLLKNKLLTMSFHTESIAETNMWINALQSYAKR
jgi:hypothetical protein